MKAGMGERTEVQQRGDDGRHHWLIQGESWPDDNTENMIRWSMDRSWRAFWVKKNGVCLIQCQVHRWFTVVFLESLNFHIIFIWIRLLSTFNLFSHSNKHFIHFTGHLFTIMDGFLELDAVDVVTCWYVSILSPTMAQCTGKVISITLYSCLIVPG